MRLSRRSKYALLALFDLAGRPDSRPVPLKELAARNKIPHKFLEQIFRPLRSAGIVHGQVGARGGYTLGRPAQEIAVGAVIRILDGTLAPVSCIGQIAYERCTCPDEQACPLRAVMLRVRQAIVAVVDSTTLADAAGPRLVGEAGADPAPTVDCSTRQGRSGRGSRNA